MSSSGVSGGVGGGAGGGRDHGPGTVCTMCGQPGHAASVCPRKAASVPTGPRGGSGLGGRGGRGRGTYRGQGQAQFGGGRGVGGGSGMGGGRGVGGAPWAPPTGPRSDFRRGATPVPTPHQARDQARREHDRQGSLMLKTDEGVAAWNQARPGGDTLVLRSGAQDPERMRLEARRWAGLPELEEEMRSREEFLKAKMPEMSRETREKILEEELEEKKKELAEIAEKDRKELEDQRAKERARDRRAKAAAAEEAELKRSLRPQLEEFERRKKKEEMEIIEAARKKKEKEKEEKEEEKKKQAEAKWVADLEAGYVVRWTRWFNGDYNHVQRQELEFRVMAEDLHREAALQERRLAFIACASLLGGQGTTSEVVPAQALEQYLAETPLLPLFPDPRPQPPRMPREVYDARRARGVHEEMDEVEDRRRMAEEKAKKKEEEKKRREEEDVERRREEENHEAEQAELRRVVAELEDEDIM